MKPSPQFIFDGESTTLGAFLCENNQSLTLEEFLRVLALQPGESVRFGGGAQAEQELRRVA